VSHFSSSSSNLIRDQRRGYSEHPRTPDPYEKVPKRTFDGRVKAWRRLLHKWDIDHAKEGEGINSTTVKEETKTVESESLVQRLETRTIEGEGGEIGVSDDDDVL
jgi:hypothetical protein